MQFLMSANYADAVTLLVCQLSCHSVVYFAV